MTAGLATPALLLHRQSEHLSFPGLVLFALPLLTIPRVNLVGTLMLADLVVLALLPALLLSGRFYLRQPLLGLILGGLGVWLAGAILTDIHVGAAPGDFLRGWAKIGFFGLTLPVVFILLNGRPERLFMLLLGLGLMLPLRHALEVDAYQTGSFAGQAWKFGNGMGLTLLLCLAVSVWLPQVRGPLVLLASPVHLFLNARALFLITVLTGLLSTVSLRIARARTRLLVGLGLLVCAVIGLPLAEQLYGSMALAGSFGEAARDKYLLQTGGGQIGILLGGRSEVLVSLQAIRDSPLLGHGSWAESIAYKIQYFAAQEALGKPVNWNTLHQDGLRIPSHSHLLGAWVEHGLAGAAFWAMALGLILRALYLGTLGLQRAEPAELFLLMSGLWDILFSPFGLQGRVIMAITLAVAVQIIQRNRPVFDAGPEPVHGSFPQEVRS